MGFSIKREAFRARGLAWSEVQGTHGVSLVFREMWATTVLKPRFFCCHELLPSAGKNSFKRANQTAHLGARDAESVKRVVWCPS